MSTVKTYDELRRRARVFVNGVITEADDIAKDLLAGEIARNLWPTIGAWLSSERRRALRTKGAWLSSERRRALRTKSA